MRPLPDAPTGRTRLRRRLAREILPAAIFLVFALIPGVARIMSEGYLLSLCARVMIFAVAALSLDLLVGCGALISFGHGARIGIGAYTVPILSAHLMRDALLSLPLALSASA